MTTIKVESQAELDRALKDAKPTDIIAIVGKGSFVLTGSAGASGSATVRAYDSATVTAYDSATVRAYDSATVRAYGSATVTAYDSATVTAYDSATVTAYGSATVTAYDSATVTASGSATVTASEYVAVHTRADWGKPNVTGGVLIHVPAIKTGADVVDYLGLALDPPLGTVAAEAKACRAAWKATPSDVGIHVHHESTFERLTEPVENRIAYIVEDKPAREKALRLRLLRPAFDLPDGWERLDPLALDPLHDARCTTCGWDGRSIFGGL